MKVRKYLVLSILFFLPLSMYIFFASGKDNFGRLPTLTENVAALDGFTPHEGAEVKLAGHITILGFLGENPMENKVNAFNLAHKIYKKNRGFDDFQFLFLLPETARPQAQELKDKIGEIAQTDRWRFAYGSQQELERVFNSLNTEYVLKSDMSSPYVFIIDKNSNLRGRNDDEDVGKLYGFDARDYAEINNKMDDDVKVILAEYRLALKKYKADRDI